MARDRERTQTNPKDMARDRERTQTNPKDMARDKKKSEKEYASSRISVYDRKQFDVISRVEHRT
jgi:hypothetical protein